MLNGALILNKPSGISSGVFSRKVKKLLNQEEKVGHAGTLDPLADGVLIVCIGEMTKFISYLTDETKTYIAEITIGIKTTTGDIEGDVVDSTKNSPSKKEFEREIKNFVGDINQKPPIFSALKYKGKPYRYYAKKGIQIQIKERKIRIENIQIISFKENKLKLKVDCGPGTYIRSLAEDICENLDTLGCISNLTRTQSAGFQIENSLKLSEITEENINKKIIPPGDALNALDRIQCRPEIVEKITNGQMIEMERASNNGFFRLFDNDENFLGIVESYGGFLKPKRLLGNFNKIGDSS